MPAKKDAPDHAKLAVEHIDLAESKTAGMAGHTLIMHKLEVAFVHALTGAGDEARDALAAAESEIERFRPSFSHIEGELALAKAKVHAALSRH